MLVSVLSYIGYNYISPTIAKGLISGTETKANTVNSKTLISNKDLSTQDESYVLIDPQTTQILKSYNADLKRAPASTTKLLTGLVAEKTLQDTDVVSVGPEVNIEGSQLGLSPGDQISVKELLTALYVHSSNDAAAALAVKISGSIPAFAEEMNNYAATLGCTDSQFTNPHGMPDPDLYTTANDLSKIASQFLKNERLMKLVKLPHARIQWKDAKGNPRQGEFDNTNLLLGNYPGDEGLKTGTTTEAGQCLVSYVTRPDGDLLLVLLGSENRYNDTIKLLDEGWADQRSKAALRGLANDPKSLIMSPGIF
ncbi:D-alanyl-D-alanine carboxypeptidase [Desulfosporosinus fructosivorans]|uniref:D-alanyl-D-alanine carboxypeptidase n=2 Tax=Desulfosporosinus fructosivorans TaxID=2018669 RepID=A0A4Z0R3D9_9FIRM|nr:D-alanyl-D-alanine carboxypeptidase [Desulfosporosinus fructosivorans]